MIKKLNFEGFFPLLLTTIVLFSILKTLFSPNVYLALERISRAKYTFGDSKESKQVIV